MRTPPYELLTWWIDDEPLKDAVVFVVDMAALDPQSLTTVVFLEFGRENEKTRLDTLFSETVQDRFRGIPSSLQ